MDPHQNFMKWGEMARKFLGNDFWGDMMETMPSSGPKADVFHGKDEVLVLGRSSRSGGYQSDSVTSGR